MQIWGVVNQKGGVGKTTTAVGVGGLLAQQGHRVLLVDLDPQGSLTRYFDLDLDNLTSTSVDLFENPDRQTVLASIQATSEPNLSLIPGSAALSAIERRKSSVPGMGTVVGKGLRQLADDFDYVLLDSPPVLGLLMVNVLSTAQQLLVPSQTEPLALEGLERMVRTLTMIEKSRGSAPPYLIVPTLHDKRTRAGKDCLNQLRSQYASNLWRGAIPVDTQLREASRQHISPAKITEVSRGLEAYQLLVKDILTGTARVDQPAQPGAWMAV